MSGWGPERLYLGVVLHTGQHDRVDRQLSFFVHSQRISERDGRLHGFLNASVRAAGCALVIVDVADVTREGRPNVVVLSWRLGIAVLSRADR
jgi:hypothetical protein